MNHRHLVDLANVIVNIRPDWKQPGTVAQLTILNRNWQGNDAALTLHAIAVASSPKANNPGAINVMTPSVQQQQPARLNEPKCYTCGNPKSVCERQQDWEIEHGLPDPHAFETQEYSIRNQAPMTPQQKAEIQANMRTMLKRVDDVPGMKHAVESARFAEQQAQEELLKAGLP